MNPNDPLIPHDNRPLHDQPLHIQVQNNYTIKNSSQIWLENSQIWLGIWVSWVQLEISQVD